jgi:predicted ATP-dependent serine protease
LPRGAVIALTGDAGSGKSTLATAWARDAWRTHGIPSVFLDRENPIHVIADRLTRLEMEDGPGVLWWGGWLPEEAPAPDSAIVRAWAREHRGIIVVDSLSAFISGDQNDATVMRACLHSCRRLADAGATPIVLHHTGKSETARDYRGSSDFAAAVDVGLHVSSFATNGRLDRLVLRAWKSRIGACPEIVYHYAGGQFVRSMAAEVRETLSEQLGDILRANPGVTARRLDQLALARGLSRDAVRTYLQDSVMAGRVDRRSGPNNAKEHYLVEAAN